MKQPSNEERLKSLPDPTPDQIQRFESNLRRCRDTGCFVWQGHRVKGYGRMRYGNTHVYAHRLAYFLRYGTWPLIVDHLCRNPHCCNPEHLESVTDKINLARGEGIGAKNSKKTHCKRGHELTGDNLKLVPHGRSCVECDRMHSREWQRKHKAASRMSVVVY